MSVAMMGRADRQFASITSVIDNNQWRRAVFQPLNPAHAEVIMSRGHKKVWDTAPPQSRMTKARFGRMSGAGDHGSDENANRTIRQRVPTDHGFWYRSWLLRK